MSTDWFTAKRKTAIELYRKDFFRVLEPSTFFPSQLLCKRSVILFDLVELHIKSLKEQYIKSLYSVFILLPEPQNAMDWGGGRGGGGDIS